MYNQWFVNINGLFDWLIFSVALFVISGKLGWQKRWKAWIPGLRMYCLGQSVVSDQDLPADPEVVRSWETVAHPLAAR